MSEKDKNVDSTRFRMDFDIQEVSCDEKTRIMTGRLVPNPNRYEKKVINGETCWYDKLDKLVIPMKVVRQMAAQMCGMPIFYKPPKITKTVEYIRERYPEIEKLLSQGIPKATFADKSDEFLMSLEQDKLGFAILSIDIVGSTKLITQLNAVEYNKLVSILFYELGAIVPLFNGHVLKYTGDGLIAYFPEPSFITQNDNALDCALSARQLILEAMNPCFKKYGLPEISIRLGLDSGEAYVQTVGNPATKQHKDIIGAVVSLAAKIQATAEINKVNLGHVMLQNLHTNWRLKCSQITLPTNWSYKHTGDKLYPVYAYQD